MNATDTRPRKGEELELEIDSLAQGGRGVARANGYVVFVSGALPGDRVRARLTRARRDYGEGTAVELLRPSSERVAERCLHEGRPCPGAPWQGMAYERQLAEKHRQVDEALRRLGHLEGFELEPIEPALAEWRYRNKLEYSFGERPGKLTLGFHERGSWASIVDVEDCLLASEANNEARNAVREWGHRQGLDAYNSRSESGVLRNLVVREGRRTGQIQTRLVTSAAEIPRPPVDLHTVIEGPSGGTDGPTGVLGAEHLDEELSGLRLRLSHSAFLQTNTEMAERLYAIAGEFAGLTGSERVFDLYCGIGTIGLSLAGQAAEVWGLEGVPEAVADAEHNAAANEISNARFVDGRRQARDRPTARRGGAPGRGDRRSAAVRAVEEDRAPVARMRGAADRLRLVQPDDAGAECGSARRGGL